MEKPEEQVTCVACGGPLARARTNVEVLMDPEVRYVFTHWGCSSFVHYNGPASVSPLALSSIR